MTRTPALSRPILALLMAMIPQPSPALDASLQPLQDAIRACWNVASLTPEALAVTVVVQIKGSANGTLSANSILMIRYDNGSAPAADLAFVAAKRALLRSVKGCGDGPAFDANLLRSRQVIEMTFDPKGITMP